MIKYIAVIAILIVLFLSGSKQIGESIKTDLKYATFNNLILNEKEAYLIRNTCLDATEERECGIKIYKSSIDDAYKHWQNLNIDIKSTIYSSGVFDKNDSIYLLVDFNDTNSLYKVSKKSKDAERLVSFKTKIDHFISNNENNYIIVDNWNSETAKKDKLGRFVYDENATNSVYENTLNEIDWKYKGKINRYSWFIFDQNNKYFLKRLGPNDQEGVQLHKELSNDVIHINMGSIDSTTMVIEVDAYWFLGKEKEKTILKKYKNGKLNVVKQFSDNKKVYPDKLYKYKDFIAVITSEAASILGTVSDMYISYDNGKNWKHYEPSGMFLKPYDFYEDKRFMAVTGPGEILVINFDKLRPKKVSN